MKYLKNEIETLYHYFFKEKGDMERSMSYPAVIKELPEVDKIWQTYKRKIEEAELIFNHRMNEIIEKLPEDEF